MTRPAEVTEVHTRIMRVTLEEDQAREYWKHAEPDCAGAERADEAFNQFWFGPRSMPRVKALLSNFDLRFGCYPHAMEALRVWSPPRTTRLLICHWHLQLADPLYRRFTGEFCVQRREDGRPLTRDVVMRWMGEQDAEDRWSAASRAQFASKLMSSAMSAGLVKGNRDPRPLVLPVVPPGAVGYLLHLLRGVDFTGSLNDNVYLRSVGLDPVGLAIAVRSVPGISVQAASDLVDIHFAHASLLDWVRETQAEELVA